MNCINSEIIQIYIDREATPEQVNRIEKHISECEKCAAMVNHQLKLISGVKKALHHLTDEPVQIPVMLYAPRQLKTISLKVKRIIYVLSAACILLFVLINIPGKSPVIQSEISRPPVSGWEVDANRPLSDQQLILNVSDAKGNVSEYMIR